METMPTAAELIRAATEAIRGELLPALSGREAFQARVIAGVLDIARREIEGAPAADAAERSRLRTLLGGPPIVTNDTTVPSGADAAVAGAAGAAGAADAADAADLPALRRALCDAIRDGRIDLDTPGLADHLWADVLARVAIEQPVYPSFVRETASRPADSRPDLP
jgi:phytoene/squalene synthetase